MSPRMFLWNVIIALTLILISIVCNDIRIVRDFIVYYCLVYCAFIVYNKLTCGINKCSQHLVGKVVIVTGADAGIGFETAKDLAVRGAKVILACRSIEKGIEARDKIVAATGNRKVYFKQLDLASFKSIENFAIDVLMHEKELHILVNNAEIVGSKRKITEDGLLVDMQTNHFGPFLLTNLMMPLLKSSAPSRIVNVSSEAHETGKIDIEDLNMEKVKYSASQAYSNTKLCNVLMTLELAKRLKGTGVKAYSLDPGTVNTGILKNAWWAPFFWKFVRPIIVFISKSPWEGAQTTIYVAVSPEVEDLSGKYFADCREKSASRLGQDEALALWLWYVSEEVTEITKFNYLV